MKAVSRSWPQLPILARARDPEHTHRLEACGTSGSVPEITEANLQLGEQLLVAIGIAEEAARSIVAEQRGVLLVAWSFVNAAVDAGMDSPTPISRSANLILVDAVMLDIPVILSKHHKIG